MKIILVPGFWLDASSWSGVAPSLTAAGHRVQALTLPGLESLDAPRAGIGLQDHVDAALAVIDRTSDSVVLVGHSGGGAIIHAALDARPLRVVRAVYVDSGPLGDGESINDALPADGDEVPLPDWHDFDDDDLVDLTDDLRAEETGLVGTFFSIAEERQNFC
jgi:pimeloyl-ACP methyl ester carboxylesterase